MSSEHQISTEDPQQEQWRLLSPYLYPRNITRYIEENQGEPPDEPVVEYVAGSMAHADEYFKAAGAVASNVRPVILYYGATNLLAGATALLSAEKPDFSSHGLRLEPHPAGAAVGQSQIVPFDPTGGAIHKFESVLGNRADLCQFGPLTLQEVLGAIPDLYQTHIQSYPGDQPHLLPIESFTVKPETHPDEDYTVDRIDRDSVDPFPDLAPALQRVRDFDAAYLDPQWTQTHVILHRRLDYVDIAEYSTNGKRFLGLCHQNNRAVICLSQLSLLTIALFALGYLSRYHAERWAPFIRSDESGERLIVEHLLDVGERYIPNLVLNVINDTRIQFRLN